MDKEQFIVESISEELTRLHDILVAEATAKIASKGIKIEESDVELISAFYQNVLTEAIDEIVPSADELTISEDELVEVNNKVYLIDESTNDLLFIADKADLGVGEITEGTEVQTVTENYDDYVNQILKDFQ